MYYLLNGIFYTERTILLRDLKFCLDTDLKIILLDHQNNYVERSNQLLKYQNFLQHLLILRFHLSFSKIVLSVYVYVYVLIYCQLNINFYVFQTFNLSIYTFSKYVGLIHYNCM